jgi:predicted ABC-type ATPase
VTEFVNADTLAHGLSAFHPDGAAAEAGRVMLRRLDELARKRTSFAFESTLASVLLARRIVDWLDQGYLVHIVYLWLPDIELAAARVRLRVRSGGHDVPPATIRRRYARGRVSFFRRLMPMSTTWRLYDASVIGGPSLIAAGEGNAVRRILNPRLWKHARTT